MELSDEGRRNVSDMAQRHGFGEDAVTHMLIALSHGGGRQAQFNHPDFGGMGQWSQGGMTMVGDMFNHAMKARVDGLCSDLSGLVQGGGSFVRQSQSQAQSHSQSGGSYQGQSQGGMGFGGGASLFVPQVPEWPADLGQPASQGAQNDMRYAYFPERRRLAIAVDGRVTVHDTGDHRISGFGQQQGGDRSLTFTSQHGVVRVADLPLAQAVPVGATAPAATPARPDHATPSEPPRPAAAGMGDEQVFQRLERLADFHQRGILSDEEFAAKKAELLARL